MAKRKKYLTLADGTRARVDYHDWLWARKFKWHGDRGYVRRGWWCKTEKRYRQIMLHREIMQRKRGRKTPRNLVIDHIDRNRRNNTRANLRMVSVKTNNWNRTNILLWDGERWVYEPHGARHGGV